jgi:hypothetical protein
MKLLRGLSAPFLALVVALAPASVAAQSIGVGLAIPQVASRGTARLTIPAYYQGLTDEFESVGSLIATRPNWTFPESGGAGTLTSPEWFQTDQAVVSGTTYGFLHANASTKNASRAAMYFGANFGADVIADFGYDTTALLPNGTSNSSNYSSTSQSFHVWQNASNSFLELTIDPTTSIGRVNMTGSLGGSTTIFGSGSTLITWQPQAGVNLGAVNARGNLHVEILGCNMRVRLDGKWLWPGGVHQYPYDVLNLCAAITAGANWSTGSHNQGQLGFVGVSTTTAATKALIQYIRGRSYDVSIDWNDQFVGRDNTTATTGTARLELSYNGTPVKWVGRLLDYTTGAQIKGWSLLANVTANGATAIKADYQMPLGGLYEIEAGYIGSDGLLHTALSRPTAAGYLFAVYGQSNSTGRAAVGAGSYSGTMSGLGAAYINSDPTITTHSTQLGGVGTPQNTREITSIWSADVQNTTGGTGTSIPSSYTIAKYLSGLTGVPVAVQVMGTTGTSITKLDGPSNNEYSDFLSARGLIRGVCEGGIFDQGEADADYTGGPLSTYATEFDTKLLPNYRAACGNPNMPVLISPFGRYATTFTTVNDSTNDSIDNGVNGTLDNTNRDYIRNQYYSAITGDTLSKTYMSSSKLGVAHPSGNPYHYPCAGCYDEINRRDAYSLAKYALGLSVDDGTGPVVSSASLSGDRTTITLNLTMDGASSIVETAKAAGSTGDQPAAQANTVKGYQVTANGFSTLLPISTVSTDGTHITIVLTSAAPAGTVKVRSFYGWDYDDTDLFYGHTYSDGRADIPVFPIIQPVTAS